VYLPSAAVSSFLAHETLNIAMQSNAIVCLFIW